MATLLGPSSHYLDQPWMVDLIDQFRLGDLDTISRVLENLTPVQLEAAQRNRHLMWTKSTRANKELLEWSIDAGRRFDMMPKEIPIGGMPHALIERLLDEDVTLSYGMPNIAWVYHAGSPDLAIKLLKRDQTKTSAFIHDSLWAATPPDFEFLGFVMDVISFDCSTFIDTVKQHYYHLDQMRDWVCWRTPLSVLIDHYRTTEPRRYRVRRRRRRDIFYTDFISYSDSDSDDSIESADSADSDRITTVYYWVFEPYIIAKIRALRAARRWRKIIQARRGMGVLSALT